MSSGMEALQLSIVESHRTDWILAEVDQGEGDMGARMRTAFIKTTEKMDEQVGHYAACKQGCSQCCKRSAVALFSFEARPLAEYVLSQPEPRRRSLMRKLRRQAQVERKHIKNKQRFPDSNHYFTPCAFLENEACSIYAERPVMCRNWKSDSVAQCHQNKTITQNVSAGASFSASRSMWAAHDQLVGEQPFEYLAAGTLAEIDRILGGKP